jgi:hypothetical protein
LSDRNEELQLTVDTLIELDEPEALLETLQRAASRKKGERWQKLAGALALAEQVMTSEPNKSEPAPPQTDAPEPKIEAETSDTPPDAA